MAALEQNGRTRRARKTKAERLAELGEKKRQLEQKAKQQLEAMEAKIKRLQQNSKSSRAEEKERKILINQIFQVAPDWSSARILGAVTRMRRDTEGNAGLSEELENLGKDQQQQLQGRRRGRRKL